MKVFVASSKRFYDKVKALKVKLDAKGIKGYYPYFDLDQAEIENNLDKKRNVTMQHFPEIDDVDVMYVVCPHGYIGYSVTIEMAYAYAKGKKIITAESLQEFAAQALVSEIMDEERFIDFCK